MAWKDFGQGTVGRSESQQRRLQPRKKGHPGSPRQSTGGVPGGCHLKCHLVAVFLLKACCFSMFTASLLKWGPWRTMPWAGGRKKAGQVCAQPPHLGFKGGWGSEEAACIATQPALTYSRCIMVQMDCVGGFLNEGKGWKIAV